MRWYWHSVGVYARRHLHIALIVLACLLPTVRWESFLRSLANLVSNPIFTLTDTSASSGQHTIALLVIAAVFALWARVQREAVVGDPLTQFTRSLPMDEATNLLLHCRVMSVANNAAWGLFVLPLVMAPYHDFGLMEVGLLLLTIINMIVFCLVLQVALLFYAGSLLILLPLLVSVECLVMQIPVDAFRLFALLLCLPSMLVLTKYYSLIGRFANGIAIPHFGRSSLHFRPSVILPLAALYWRLVSREEFTKTTLLVGFYVLLCATLIFLMIKDNGLPYFQNFMVILSFVVSGYYCVFYDRRQGLEALFYSMPISLHTMAVWDIAIAIITVTLLSAPLAVYADFYGYFSMLSYLSLLILQVPLLVGLYFVRNFMPKQGGPMAFSLSVVWVLLSIQVR